MESDWEKPYEDDGLALGPEDALRREIEKSKTLKVEKLQLRDAIEKLKAKNDALSKTNQSLKQKLNSLVYQSVENDADSVRDTLTTLTDQTQTIKWSFYLLIFNLAALAILLILLLKQ